MAKRQVAAFSSRMLRLGLKSVEKCHKMRLQNALGLDGGDAYQIVMDDFEKAEADGATKQDLIDLFGDEGTFVVEVPDKVVTPDDDYEIITTCDEVASIRWVLENLERTVKKKDAPSNTAWTLYKYADSNAMNKADFINKSWTKLIPTNKALENATGMQDDGRKTRDLIKQIKKENE